MNAKTLLAKLERMGSLSQIIWMFLAILFFLFFLVTFSDSVLPNNNNVMDWGKVDPKSQMP
jgi:hypothetical protein